MLLQINGAQDHGSDLLSDSWIILWADRLAGILDTRDPGDPKDLIAQIDEETEPVVAQHNAPDDNPAGEA